MAKFTLLEIHLDDATLTANAPFSGESENVVESESETESESDDNSDTGAAGGGPPIKPILVVVALVVLAAAAKKLVGGESIEEVDIDTEADIEVE